MPPPARETAARCNSNPRPTMPRSALVRVGGAPFPGQSVGNDVAGRLSAGEAETKARIDKGRTQVSAQDAGTLSESYKGSVRIGKVSTNHGEPQAVWDTVGANASQPDLGTPPKVEPMGEWHFVKDGVPLAGPEPHPALPSTKPDPLSGREAGRTVRGTLPTQGK